MPPAMNDWLNVVLNMNVKLFWMPSPYFTLPLHDVMFHKLYGMFFEDGLKSFYADRAFEIIEHFHKTAHVCAFEMMGQIDIHIERGVDRLSAPGAVQDNNRIFNILYTDFFNINIAGIFLALNVNHKIILNKHLMVIPVYK